MMHALVGIALCAVLAAVFGLTYTHKGGSCSGSGDCGSCHSSGHCSTSELEQ